MSLETLSPPNKQTGTIFHRTKANVSVLLSNALSKQSNNIRQINSGDDLSVHKLTKHFSSHTSDPNTSLVLDLDAYINEVCSVAPELWDLVCNLTMTIDCQWKKGCHSRGYICREN